MDVSAMLSEIDDHGFLDTEQARKVQMLNHAYFDIVGREPWPFLEDTITVTPDGTGKMAALRDHKILSLVNTTAGRMLTPYRLEDFTEGWPGSFSEGGESFLYYPLGRDWFAWPIDSATQLTARVLITPTALTASTVEEDILIPERHQEVIVLGALARLYRMEDDLEQRVVVKDDFNEKLAFMYADLSARQYDRPDVIRVLPDDWGD